MTDIPTPPDDNDIPASDDAEETLEITIEAVMDVLCGGEMESTHGLLRYSSNYTFLVTMQKGDVCIPAVYKPRKGERPLWDFPDGTLCNRERAAFLTSDLLGWGIVPPTVLGEGPHGTGSIQFYVDHDPEINYFSLDETFAPQLARIALFDVLVNNADRKGGHILLDGQGQLWGIDHGIAFNEDHKLRTVVWDFAGQPVPSVFMDDVQRLCEAMQDETSAYYTEMVTLLDNYEMAAFQKRIDRVLMARRYPNPGPGPNYPWPAV